MTEALSKLADLEAAILTAVGSIRIDEASLKATWPAAASAAAAKRLLAGAVLQINSAAPAAAPAFSMHYVPRDGVNEQGDIAIISPPVPDGAGGDLGLPLARAALNTKITGIARNVLSTVDASGAVVEAGRQLSIAGEPIAVHPDTGRPTYIVLRFLNVAASASTLSHLLNAATIASFGVSLTPWVQVDAALRAATDADARLLAARINRSDAGHLARSAASALSIEIPPAAGAVAANVGRLTALVTALAGDSSGAEILGRGMGAAAHAMGPPVVAVPPYGAPTLASALEVFDMAVAMLGALASSGIAMATAGEMAPTAGVAPILADMRPAVTGARMRAMVVASAGAPAPAAGGGVPATGSAGFAENLAGAHNVDWDALSAKLPAGKDGKSKARRKVLWKRADPNGNGYLSSAEV